MWKNNYQLLFRNTKQSTVSGCKAALFLVTTPPAMLNKRSDGTEVAEIVRSFCASFCASFEMELVQFPPMSRILCFLYWLLGTIVVYFPFDLIPEMEWGRAISIT